MERRKEKSRRKADKKTRARNGHHYVLLDMLKDPYRQVSIELQLEHWLRTTDVHALLDNEHNDHSLPASCGKELTIFMVARAYELCRKRALREAAAIEKKGLSTDEEKQKLVDKREFAQQLLLDACDASQDLLTYLVDEFKHRTLIATHALFASHWNKMEQWKVLFDARVITRATPIAPYQGHHSDARDIHLALAWQGNFLCDFDMRSEHGCRRPDKCSCLHKVCGKCLNVEPHFGFKCAASMVGLLERKPIKPAPKVVEEVYVPHEPPTKKARFERGRGRGRGRGKYKSGGGGRGRNKGRGRGRRGRGRGRGRYYDTY